MIININSFLKKEFHAGLHVMSETFSLWEFPAWNV